MCDRVGSGGILTGGCKVDCLVQSGIEVRGGLEGQMCAWEWEGRGGAFLGRVGRGQVGVERQVQECETSAEERLWTEAKERFLSIQRSDRLS